MAELTFTAYIPPNATRKPITLELPEEVVEKGRQLQENGFELTLEPLSIGGISICIADPQRDLDVACQIASDETEVPEKTAAMIMEFDLFQMLQIRTTERMANDNDDDEPAF